MIKLLPTQAIHYPTIKYFLDESRANGKTFLLAFTYLMCAIEHPGKSYEPIDFPHNHFQSRKFLMDNIINLAKELGINITVRKADMSFSCEHVNIYLDKDFVDRLASIGLSSK